MRRRHWHKAFTAATTALAALAAFALYVAPADAAPPRSCAAKFVGVWRNAAQNSNWIETRVHANGTATPVCVPQSSCVAVQQWTCEGNVYRFSNDNFGATRWEATLSPDGSRLETGGTVAIRAGARRKR